MLLGDVIGDPYYWGGVTALTLAFTIVDYLALDRRELGRSQGWAVALYVASWGIVLGLSLPVAPLGSIWWVFPWAFRLAVTVMLVGGNVLAGVFRVEQSIAHPDRRTPHPPAPGISDAELREAEEYDEQWQQADRHRNREAELHRQHDSEARRHHDSCS